MGVLGDHADGGLGLIVNGAYFRALPSVGLNVVWVFISVAGLRKAKSSSGKQV